MSANTEWPELNAQSNAAWEANAEHWDSSMGQIGNRFHLQLVRPAMLQLLGLQAGQRMLDVGCGNGLFARHLAELGATVLAVDASASLIARAKQYPVASSLEYQVVDATSFEQLLSLGVASFDALVSTMVLMDLPTLEPLFQAASQLLKPQGRFVLASVHPCFQAPQSRKIVEQFENEQGEVETRSHLQIGSYLTPATHQGVGVVGQPMAQWFFHRSLASLLGAAFAAGFVLDGLLEPSYPPDTPRTHPFSWANFSEIPPVLVLRLRRN
ncbi:class I SAM-dependent methyltransferase [Herpetosiphon giganteus]|uniref:class I SAM-dependent methyltransferase n=1 Tax=Herpetosiphon giganteus TaxID=2029754 RepID=UPI001957671E|nr:class I SAM-dependent methyltransferase [Herpetosiphon giganteus]MBM7841914.1 2-polyprenyl-3-methyl-5-hydroxy-6-metoxy-1,4-benzoquinol methylase [Herpetosiphon giganteus]